MDDILKRKAAAINSFTKIGKANGSAPPVAQNNSTPIVYEALIAQALYKVAEARKTAAMNDLREAGIVDADYKPGDYTPFAADGLSVSVKRNNDSETIDSTKLKNELTKVLGEDKTKALLSAVSKPRKGNTTVTVGVM